jgi:hypothetical protein
VYVTVKTKFVAVVPLEGVTPPAEREGAAIAPPVNISNINPNRNNRMFLFIFKPSFFHHLVIESCMNLIS